MYAAFNTLQLELERLIIMQECIAVSGQATTVDNKIKLAELELKILSHQKAVKVLLRQHFAEHKLIVKTARAIQQH